MDLKSTIANIDFVIKNTEVIREYYVGKEYCEIQMYTLSMIDRLNFSTKSLKLLLHDIQINPSHEYSCGIIIRAQMFDCLIVLNAINKIDSIGKLDLLREFCVLCLCDTVKYVMEHLETTQPDKLSLYMNLVLMHPLCFEEYSYDGTRPILKSKARMPSAKELQNQLSTSKYSTDASWAFESYNYYSKYDHFGNLFYSMSRIPDESKLSKLEESIKLFTKSFYYSIILLQVKDLNDIFLNNQRLIVSDYIKLEGL